MYTHAVTETDRYPCTHAHHTQALSAPTLYVNKWGKWSHSDFPGQCAIADADGNVLVRMAETGNGSEVREIQLGRALSAERESDPLKSKRPVVNAKKRFCGGSWVMWLTIPLEFFGKKSYAKALPVRKEMMAQLAEGGIVGTDAAPVASRTTAAVATVVM